MVTAYFDLETNKIHHLRRMQTKYSLRFGTTINKIKHLPTYSLVRSYRLAICIIIIVRTYRTDRMKSICVNRNTASKQFFMEKIRDDNNLY